MNIVTAAGLRAELELHDAKLEAYDMEGSLGFATNVLTQRGALFGSSVHLTKKNDSNEFLFPEGLRFDGEDLEPLQLVSPSLRGGFESKWKFGVLKHSELEPDYCLAKGNGYAEVFCCLTTKILRRAVSKGLQLLPYGIGTSMIGVFAPTTQSRR